MDCKPFRLFLVGLAAGTSTTALSHSAFAQTEGDASEALPGEIVVTAQKREQSLSDVGLTVAAATADTLLQRGVTDISDLAKIVPGFTAASSGYATPVYTLRGIGLFDYSLGASPAVAVYVDEIARPFPLTQMGVALDLERVEVMKGPQGTLFGQSSTGGAINYIAAKPTDTFKAGFDASYERFGKADLGGFVSGPLSDTLKGRLAVKAVTGGAWQYSVSRPHDKNGKSDLLQGRILLDWEPSDRLRFSLNVNGLRDKSENQQGQFLYNNANIEATPGSVNPYEQINPGLYAAFTDPTNAGYDSTFLTRKSILYARMRGVPHVPGASNLPTDPASASALLAGPNGDGTALCANDTSQCIRQTEWNSEWPTGSDDSYYQFALRSEYDLTDDVTLTSLTSYQKSNVKRFFDLDGTTAQGFSEKLHGGIENFSQELRAAGKTGSLNWIVGGNYDWSKVDDYMDWHTRDTSTLETFPGMRFFGFRSSLEQTIKSYALFANADYEVTSNFTVQGGVRYTNTKRKASHCSEDISSDQALSRTFGNSEIVPGFGYYDLQTVFGLGSTNHLVVHPGECYPLDNMLPAGDPGFLRPAIEPFTQHLNEDNISFRVGANYKTDGGTLFYATFSQGYKSGVITNLAPAFTNQYIPAKQEKVTAYEGGIKTSLFDRRVQVNGAAFYYDYRDKQVRARVLDPVFGPEEKMINVPKSYIWGFEGEILARPVDGLTLSASGTYLKSKVNKEFSTFAGGPIFNGANYTGNFQGSKLPFTPTYSGVFDGQYEAPLFETVNAFFGTTVTYASKDNVTFHNDIVRADGLFRRAHTLLDLRAGLADPDGAWRLTAYAQNVTNQFYETSVFSTSDVTQRQSGKPRIIGMRLSMRVN